MVNTGLPESIPDSALAVEAQMVGAGCRRKASCNPARLAKSGGRVSKAAKPGAEQPEPRTAPQGEHGEDCEHPPFDTALGQRPQLNKPTSGRQARPPKGVPGHFPARVFMYIKTYLATRFAGPDRTRAAWQRISAPFVKTVEPLCFSRQSENAGSAQPGQPGRVAVVANRCCGIPSQTERGRR